MEKVPQLVLYEHSLYFRSYIYISVHISKELINIHIYIYIFKKAKYFIVKYLSFDLDQYCSDMECSKSSIVYFTIYCLLVVNGNAGRETWRTSLHCSSLSLMRTQWALEKYLGTSSSIVRLSGHDQALFTIGKQQPRSWCYRILVSAKHCVIRSCVAKPWCGFGRFCWSFIAHSDL